MYQPKPEDEVLIFQSHKVDLNNEDLGKLIAHAQYTTGEGGEVEVTSAAPDRLWAVGPRGILKWITDAKPTYGDPFEIFIDFDSEPVHGHTVEHWYFNSEDKEVWVQISDEQVMTYKQWYKYAADAVDQATDHEVEPDPNEEFIGQGPELKRIPISQDALTLNYSCWGGHTLVAWASEEENGEDDEFTLMKITYDEILSIKDYPHKYMDEVISFVIEADTSEGVMTYYAQEILFLNDYKEWCEDNNRVLVMEDGTDQPNP